MSRPFFDVARDLRRGQFLDECTEKMQEVINSVEETNKSAKLIIEVTVQPASRLGGAVKVSDKVTTKLPALEAGETIMFVTNDNNLVANDPRQQNLELKSVSTKEPDALKKLNA